MRQVTSDSFSFSFPDAVDAFKFDEEDSNKPFYHGLSDIMKSVDIVAEFDQFYLFVEAKRYLNPTRPNKPIEVNSDKLLNDIIGKFCDTFLYRFAEEKTDKPIRYVCLLLFLHRGDKALQVHLADRLKKRLPWKRSPRWKKELAESCVIVFDIDTWQRHFPKWTVSET